MKDKKKKSVYKHFLSSNYGNKKKVSIAIFIFSFFLGVNTLNHSFTLDDEIYYSKNKISQEGISGVADMFSKGSTTGFKETGKKDLYRPLVLLSFGIEKTLFNNKPVASHFVQILLYACCCILVYSFLNIVFSSFHFLIPLFIALLFAAHPVHTEVMASIKSRDELLAFLFSILCLRNFVLMDAANSKNRMIYGLFFLFCALLSKESAMMLIVIIPVTIYFLTNLPIKKIFLTFLFAAGISGVYFLMRISVIPFSTISLPPDLINNSLMAATSKTDMIATDFVMLFKYLKLLFLPFSLSYDYSYNQIPIVSWSNLVAMCSLVIYLALVIYAILNFKRKGPIAFGILFFLLSLFLSSNLLLKIDATMGLRFLFTPTLGFCVAVVFLMYKIFKLDTSSNPTINQKKKIIILFSGLICICFALTVARNADWKDNFTLFSHDVNVSPNSSRIHSSLAFEYAMKAMRSSSNNERNELLQNSIVHYKRALEIYPDHPDANYNLGLAYFNIGEKEKAIQCYWKATEVNPKLIDPDKELGGIYYNDHLKDSSIFYFKRVLALDSTDQKAIEIINYLKKN